MEIQSRSRSIALPSYRMPLQCGSSMSSRRSLERARRVRERVLASLAFVMLVMAWDATLRLDERVAPPRMRVSHAVEQGGVAPSPQGEGGVRSELLFRRR